MFRKMTPHDHHKSFMPFDYLFMTKEQYDEFVKKTQPSDAPVVVEVSGNTPSVEEKNLALSNVSNK